MRFRVTLPITESSQPLYSSIHGAQRHQLHRHLDQLDLHSIVVRVRESESLSS